MYIAEAIPTVVIGVITFFVLTDRPEQAKFLTTEERNWLVTTIATERRATEAVRKFTLWQALYNPKVLLLALNYLGIVTASLGMLIFIPQMIKSLGDYSNMTVGWLTMIPYTCGAIAMVVWGRISDRMNERRWNLFIGCLFSAAGLVIAGMTMGPGGRSLECRSPRWVFMARRARFSPCHRCFSAVRRSQQALPGSTRSATSEASSDPGISAS